MSIKKNFIYSSLSGTMQYLVILITFPYISRVLGVSNVGIVNFVENTINYFLLFAAMGINVLGIREISKSRGDSLRLQNTFSSLIAIHTIFTVVVIFFYLIIILNISQFSTYKSLLFIGGAKIFFSLFLIEWFYKGLEDFKYVTIRNVIVRLLYVVLIFIFIKQPSDYILYFILTILIVFINALINFIYSFKFVKFSFSSLYLKKYIYSFLTLGVYAILTSMYTTFNVVYLGLVSNSEQVGFYTTALKLYIIVLGLFGAFTGVMLPRMSSLVEERKMHLFNEMLLKSFKIVFTFCFPLIIVTVILAPYIITIIAGRGYEGAIIPMQIIMPLILIVGLAQILVFQVLMPMRKDKIVLFASILGAVLGIVLNICFVSKYRAIGSALVLVISEITVTLFYIFFLRKMRIFNFLWKFLLRNLFLSIPYIFISLFCIQYIPNPLFIVLGTLLISISYFFILEYYYLKNEFVVILIKTLFKR